MTSDGELDTMVKAKTYLAKFCENPTNDNAREFCDAVAKYGGNVAQALFEVAYDAIQEWFHEYSFNDVRDQHIHEFINHIVSGKTVDEILRIIQTGTVLNMRKGLGV